MANDLKKKYTITYSNGIRFTVEAYDAKHAWAKAIDRAYNMGYTPIVHHIEVEGSRDFYSVFIFNYSTD
jgi:hypothetical protein